MHEFLKTIENDLRNIYKVPCTNTRIECVKSIRAVGQFGRRKIGSILFIFLYTFEAQAPTACNIIERENSTN